MLLARALHPEEEEHGDDGEEGPHGVRHDELQRVVVRDQQDVQHRRRREVPRQLDLFKSSLFGGSESGFESHFYDLLARQSNKLKL